MKNILLLLILLDVFTTVASLTGISYPAVAGNDPDFSDALDCLIKTKKYSYASPIIMSYPEGIDDGDAMTIVKTRAYFKNVHLVFFGCGSRSVEILVSEFVKKVPKSLYDELYILPHHYFY